MADVRVVDLCWITADKGGSRHYRADLPAAFLAGNGYDTFVGTLAGSAPNGLIYSLDETQCPVFGKVVILQRQGAEAGPSHLDRARAAGQQVWMDCDDLLTAAPPDNYARAGSGAEAIAWWAHMLPHATGILCATTQIHAGLARHNRRRVVAANLFDGDLPDRWRPRPFPSTVRALGWVGNTVVHRRNLAECRGWLWEVLEAHNLDFRWGGILSELGEDISEFADLVGVEAGRVEAVPAAPIETYPSLFDKIDVGIVPLADSRFARAKTALKGLEFAAAGIPFCYSASQNYLDLFGTGPGRCRHSGEWRRKLDLLVADDETRHRAAKLQRAAMLSYCDRARLTWERVARDLVGEQSKVAV